MRFRELCWIAGGLGSVLAIMHGPTARLIVTNMVPVSAVAAEASEGQKLLEQLIEGARKEGQVNWYPVSSLRSKGVKAMAQAFNQRFGLNVRLKADTSGGTTAKFSKAVMEAKTGLTPTFDVMYGPDHRVVRLWQSGGVEHIDKWELILKAISPEAYAVRNQVSPLDLAGYAFQWGNRMKAINYNADLISEDKLPQTRVELGDPKFKGMYVLPPWVTASQYGILVYPKNGGWRL